MQFDTLRGNSFAYHTKEVHRLLSNRAHCFLRALPFSKLIMQMKLISFFLMVICVQASASVSAQKITLIENKASLQKVLREIRKQSDFDFIVNAKNFKDTRPLTLTVRDMPLEEVLQLVFADQPVEYVLDNKTIIIRDRGASAGPETAAENNELRVTGTVMNDRDEPLSGVSVVEKGTENGVVTNENGRFFITVKNASAILQITYVGYKSQEVSVLVSDISVVLELANGSLSDVVVVGYGQQKKSDLTGSISSVAGKDLTHLSTQRVDQALQGRAAGVMVWNTDASPGGNTIVRIRGMNSITGGNSALIVVDGLIGGNLSSLNPNDIASIEVLKDASATAIYGARGANGVVLVTTKRGEKSKPKINYNYTITNAKLTKKLPLMSAVDFAKNVNARHLAVDNLGITPLPIFSDSQIDSLQRYGGTDWQSLVYRAATTQNHQLSVSGGTDNLYYFVSGGYLDQKGILINTNYKRYSLRANLEAKLTKWASFAINWNGTKEDRRGTDQAVQEGSAIKDALLFDPTLPVYDSEGNFTKPNAQYSNPIMVNPMASLLGTNVNYGTIGNNVGASLTFSILEGLSLRVSGGLSLYNSNDGTFYDRSTWNGNTSNGMGIVSNSKSTYAQNTNMLTYNKSFNGRHKDDHKLTVTLVQEQSATNSYSSTIVAQNFLIQQTNIDDLGGASKLTSSSSRSKRVLLSYLGRINYSFEGKYFLTASYRADGSSVFGVNNKWGKFPSAALAWRASEEEFIKDLGFISNLKFRGTWGVTGNQAINAYQTLASLRSGQNYAYDGGDGMLIGLAISRLPNPGLKWESTEQYDVGIDLGFFNNRLTFTADYYKKTTTDLLLNRSLPGYVGLTSIISNVGSMGNRGVELAVGGDPLVGKFKWHTGFNISFNRAKVISLGETPRLGFISGGEGYQVNDPFMWLIPGQPYGQMYGWIFEGLWKTSEAQEAARYGQLPGDPRYFDKNKDGRIDINDTTVMGNAMPKYFFGWNNEISFKNFELSFLFEGRVGNNIFNVQAIKLVRESGTRVGTSEKLSNRWSPQNESSTIPPVMLASIRDSLTANLGPNTVIFPSVAANQNSQWVEDGSYVRLKNVTLTYNFSPDVLRKLRFNNMAVYVSGTNLLTFTKYSGYDPEVSSFTANDASLGSDYGSYPPQRTFSLGLKLTF